MRGPEEPGRASCSCNGSVRTKDKRRFRFVPKRPPYGGGAAGGSGGLRAGPAACTDAGEEGAGEGERRERGLHGEGPSIRTGGIRG
jgi:hypothetical protein